MDKSKYLIFLLGIMLATSSCVSKKKFLAVQDDLTKVQKDLGDCGVDLNRYMNQLTACQQEKDRISASLKSEQSNSSLREEQIRDLKDQITDIRSQRDAQLQQVEGLTQLSQSANKNIEETLSQLETKDRYIHLLHAAKSRTDSINLALAVNLKSVLAKGLEDEDIEVKVDKTVVFINLSDKMLYRSGSAEISDRANEVLGKIATIIESRPDVEVLVEGYTDNVPIQNQCMQDNWDLSVKRATSVVRALQENHDIDPNRLIAAGRGEWNTLATNDTEEGRSINRRTRIVIMPKLDQFYDLLNPKMAAKLAD
ncbi:MAG: OmpA family protein [Saprospiraceae bacterium]|nr:OmpA family protein [Saprospiraceae bacterium]